VAARSATPPGDTVPVAAASDAGDAPGKAPGVQGATESSAFALATRSLARARLPGSGNGAGAFDASGGGTPADATAQGPAPPIGAAQAGVQPYEPALAPALAAYVRAAARESQR
jgi:hypothetical protein